MRKKLSRHRIIKDKKAASPAISMVIITAVTVVLVLVAGSFAVQVLDRQQASTEFNALQKSILALDDAVRDVAWKEGASRSVHFATGRGSFQTASTNRSVSIEFDGVPVGNAIQTSVVKYVMSDSYIALEKEQSYILGDADPAVSSASDSLGQVSLTRESGFASISLGYRVRVSNEGSYLVGSPQRQWSYVNIMIIELSCADLSGATGDFDMIARNIGVDTTSYQFPNKGAGSYEIDVYVDEVKQPPPVSIFVADENTVVNLIISKVSVSP
jgi:hypothetical protein